MGSELLVDYLAIPAGKDCNWKAAEELVKRAEKDDELRERFINAYCEAVYEETGEVVEEESISFANDVVPFAMQAIEAAKALLEKRRDTALIKIPQPDGGIIEVYLTAEHSNGDPLDNQFKRDFFYETGMAKAAGFLTFEKL